MGKKGKKCHFRPDWFESNPEWRQWLHPVTTDSTIVRCSLCNKVVHLSNMGRQAVISHCQSNGHRSNMKSASQPSADLFLRRLSEGTTVQGDAFSVQSDSVVGLTQLSRATSTCSTTEPNTGLMPFFIQGEDVRKAEIIWCLKVIMGHVSYNFSRDIKHIFGAMFPDSAIAKSFALGSDKLAYSVTYGLGPYFHDSLVDILKNAPAYVVCFDEALNRVVQRGQMDLLVRYWAEAENKVTTRYLKSLFLGHCRAVDLCQKMQEGLSEISLSKVIQVSMDGPNVNFKFLEELTEIMKDDVDTPELLNIGSCGLHVIHGAFQTGHSVTGWNVNASLRALHGLFKDAPVRRADYIAVTETNIFPLKFCQVRWIENARVAERAVEILPHVKKYIGHFGKKLPITITSTAVKEACKDQLTTARLAFFASVAREVEPFLKKFQSAHPLVPFLYDELLNIVRSLMKRCVKKDVLEQSKTHVKLHKINLDVGSKDLLNAKCVVIGVAAVKELQRSAASDLQKAEFFMDCRKFLCSMIAKILERSPLKYKLTYAVSCLVPKTIVLSPALAEKKMGQLVQILYNENHITSSIAEKVQQEFCTLCTSAAEENLKSSFLSFSSKDRLDSFYSGLLSQDAEFQHLWQVVKLVLILSHGNATVESGFSINKDMLVENMHEESVVAQRQVYDAIAAAGGVLSVIVDQKMLRFVKGSRMRYEDALSVKRNGQQKQSDTSKKRRIANELKILQEKKLKLVKEQSQAIDVLEREIEQIKKLA